MDGMTSKRSSYDGTMTRRDTRTKEQSNKGPPGLTEEKPSARVECVMQDCRAGKKSFPGTYTALPKCNEQNPLQREREGPPNYKPRAADAWLQDLITKSARRRRRRQSFRGKLFSPCILSGQLPRGKEKQVISSLCCCCRWLIRSVSRVVVLRQHWPPPPRRRRGRRRRRSRSNHPPPR